MSREVKTDHSYSNTKPHQKGKHLKLNDRTTIQG
ncbi:hypothetical protein ACXO70_08200, partial [Lactobacillus delbrueckii subsp. bulgaricus]